MEEYIVKASSKDEALKLAANHFGSPQENIELTVIEEAKKIFGRVISPCVFKAELKQEVATETAEEAVEEVVEETRDGTYEILYTEEGVKLNVDYPTGNGKAVLINDIMATIERKQISGVHIMAIRQALNLHTASIIIANRQEQIIINESVQIHTSIDKLQAVATFLSPECGESLTFENFLDSIRREKIVYGLDHEKLLKIFNEREYGKEYIIAEGLERIDGEDGKLQLKYDFDKKPQPKLDEDGNVDYFNLDMFISVDEGDVVGEYQNPTKGVAGMDVYGHTVKAIDGKKVKAPLGKNVGLAEDGMHIVAKKKGLLEFLGDKLSVAQTLYIDGDADISTGNINFIGNVKIHGSVKPGMIIKAEGTVEVDGTVESACIEAAGSIVLKGGIRGIGKSELKAAGDVEAKYIENSAVFSGACVRTQATMNSDIECHDFVMPSGSKGLIIGGNILAMHSVVCGSLGSTSCNTQTVVEVGNSSDYRKRMNELQKNISNAKHEIEKIDTVMAARGNELVQVQRIMMEKLLTERENKKQVLDELNGQMDKLIEKTEQSKNGFISVLGTANAGAEIIINKATLVLDSAYIHTTFKCSDGEIAISAYEGN